MKTKILKFVIIFFIALFTNCEKEEKHACATCSDNITFNSFGEWTLQEEGPSGFSGGNNPVNIVSDCSGWGVCIDTMIFNLHVFATGSCDLGALFYWIDEKFTSFMVMEGWEGSTEEGIKIGDDTTKFLSVYTYFEYPVYKPPAPKPDTNFIYLEYQDDTKGEFVGAVFSREGKLVQLYIQKTKLGYSKGTKGKSVGLIPLDNGKLIPWYQNEYLRNYTKK
ncbi:MAG: hypothetical protein ABIE36_01735 [Candidatus Diapherotrites archaeon]